LSTSDSEDEIDAGDPDIEGPETDGESLSLTVADPIAANVWISCWPAGLTACPAPVSER